MEYKKIIRDNYTLHFIKNERFKTIGIDVAFSSSFDKSDSIYLNLLSKMLISSTKKYKTSKEMAIASEDLYGANIFSSTSLLGNISRLLISFDFLNPKYTNHEMIEKSIDFLKQCIINPNVNSGKFDEKIFSLSKTNLVSNLEGMKDNASTYSYMKFKELLYKGTPMSFHLYQKISILKKVSSEELYKFYKKVITTYKIDVFVNGNIEDENEYIKYIDELFKNVDNNFNKTLSFEINTKEKELKEVKEKRDFKQSTLFVGYQFIDLTEYEKRYLIHLYSSILGGLNNSILFTNVREKNSLCYSISSFVNKNPSVLSIETEINKKNYEKTLSLIDECVQKMSDTQIIKKLFETAKSSINTSLNLFYDDKSEMLEHYYAKEFDNIDDIETRRNKFLNAKIEDIIKLNDKLKKSVIYFLEGDYNEENSI